MGKCVTDKTLQNKEAETEQNNKVVKALPNRDTVGSRKSGADSGAGSDLFLKALTGKALGVVR